MASRSLSMPRAGVDFPHWIHLGGNQPKTTFARSIMIQSAPELILIKVGPVDVGGIIFGVGPLPDEEVGDAQFSGRANDEVRVRLAGGK